MCLLTLVFGLACADIVGVDEERGWIVAGDECVRFDSEYHFAGIE